MASISNVHLPLEVWELIFSYLDSTDLINFCQCSKEYKSFLRDKTIVQNFNVGRNYNFCERNLLNYVKDNIAYEYIRKLNVNQLYWIKLEDMRKLVGLLPNLEELLALNTTLSVRRKDLLLYGKLKTLALTVEGGHFIEPGDLTVYKNNLFLLKKLCIQMTRKQPKMSILYFNFFHALVALRELWVCDLDGDERPLNYDSIVASLKFLEKLVIKTKTNIPFLNYKPFQLTKYFESRRFKSIMVIYERFPNDAVIVPGNSSVFDPPNSKLEVALNVLRTYRSEMPYNASIHRKIYLTNNINDAKFEELNFFHHKCFCTKDYIRAAWDFLKSENSRNLQKLSIKSCVLQCAQSLKKNTWARLKREYPITDIIGNCRKIKVLELMECLSCNVTIVDSYPFICKWTDLESLTLEIPVHVNCAFLVNLTSSCKNLKHLRLVSYHTNEHLNKIAIKALPFATNLQDFSFENKEVDLQSLFHALSQKTGQTLRRIYVSCHEARYMSLDPLDKFLARNPQLVFLLLSIKTAIKPHLFKMQRILSRFSQNRAEKGFYCQNQPRGFIREHYLGVAHDPFMNFDSQVSTIDMFSFR